MGALSLSHASYYLGYLHGIFTYNRERTRALVQESIKKVFSRLQDLIYLSSICRHISLFTYFLSLLFIRYLKAKSINVKKNQCIYRCIFLYACICWIMSYLKNIVFILLLCSSWFSLLILCYCLLSSARYCMIHWIDNISLVIQITHKITEVQELKWLDRYLMA